MVKYYDCAEEGVTAGRKRGSDAKVGGEGGTYRATPSRSGATGQIFTGQRSASALTALGLAQSCGVTTLGNKANQRPLSRLGPHMQGCEAKKMCSSRARKLTRLNQDVLCVVQDHLSPMSDEIHTVAVDESVS